MEYFTRKKTIKLNDTKLSWNKTNIPAVYGNNVFAKKKEYIKIHEILLESNKKKRETI
jgi:hypothetical protein